jgi:hypothetical protein
MKAILTILGSVSAAAVLTIIWWRLWMNHGVWGPPAFLKSFLLWDGEAAYDRVALEMFLVLLAVLLLVVGLVRLRQASGI